MLHQFDGKMIIFLLGYITLISLHDTLPIRNDMQVSYVGVCPLQWQILQTLAEDSMVH